MDGLTPVHEKLSGMAAHEAAVDQLLARARRTLRIFDRELAASFDSPARHELLRAFLSRDRQARLQIVVHDAGTVHRNCPRLLGLLRSHAHAIAIHATEAEAKHASDPMTIVDDVHHLHRFHYDGWRALLALDDPQGTHPLLQRFAEIWDASVPAVSATTLGL